MQELVYLNGWVGSFDNAHISINDRGYNFGDGIYEVVRTYDGKMFAVDDHLKRLETSAAVLEIGLPWDKKQLNAIISDLLEQSEIREAIIYIQITRGTAHRNHLYDPDIRPNLLVTIRSTPDIPQSTYIQGVNIISCPEFRWQMCHVKSTSLAAAVMAKNKAHRAGAAEAVFVMDDGTVTECTSSNIFIYKGGTLMTHPANNRILAGITRKHILNLAEGMGMHIRPEPFKFEDMIAADEVFLTGSISEVIPVVDIDGQTIAGGKPGPITGKLHQAFISLRS
ncbi:D-amino-acid transaminase [Desulfoscipio sp. XC116]|uniref:D-amino-acid transaminase n=1 Tax=Desulfoscipio sp. XC116 TaxID=3144975 RepID=UPI00325B08FE